jgi:hypothetical protein
MDKHTLMYGNLGTMSIRDLFQAELALTELEGALTETIRAADRCETWAYYGRSSRDELPSVRQRLYNVKQELRKNGY